MFIPLLPEATLTVVSVKASELLYATILEHNCSLLIMHNTYDLPHLLAFLALMCN